MRGIYAKVEDFNWEHFQVTYLVKPTLDTYDESLTTQVTKRTMRISNVEREPKLWFKV